MEVNGEHPTFKLNGDDNFPYESGKLQAFLVGLAERVESSVFSAEEYVEELKERGILES